MYPHGGYKTQTVIQLGNLLAALNQGRISFSAVRIYFAALAVVAAREAADRSRPRGKSKCVTPRFLLDELAQLTGYPRRRVRRELRSLERAGLLLFSETVVAFTGSVLPGSHEVIADLAGSRSPARPVPLPRPAIRFIARCSKVATMKTMLAYCVRGLTISRDGQVTGKGTAKASWIAETCGLSLRAVRVARAELIGVGFITRDECSTQWKLNRHGAYFAINMLFQEWQMAVVDKLDSRDRDSAPLRAEECPASAPPYKDLKTPCGSKNQKARSRDQSGLLMKGSRKPKLAKLDPDDLKRLSSLREVYRQIVAAGWLEDSEANFKNCIAAAVRATRAKGDSVRIFVSIVRRQLWHHISQVEEDRAEQVIRRSREKMAAAEHKLWSSICERVDLARVMNRVDAMSVSMRPTHPRRA